MNRNAGLVLIITTALIITYTVTFPFQNNNPQAQTPNPQCYDSPVCIWNEFNSRKCSRGFGITYNEPIIGCMFQDTFSECMEYKLCNTIQASAGPDQTIIDRDNSGDETVMLNGSGSHPTSIDEIRSYTWSGYSGITNPHNVIASVNLPVGGPHKITLTVANKFLINGEIPLTAKTSKDSVDITILSPPPLTPPFTPPSFPLSTTIPTTIPFPISPPPPPTSIPLIPVSSIPPYTPQIPLPLLPPPIAFPAPITLPDTLTPTFPMPPSPSSINCSLRTTSEECFAGQYPIYQCRWDAQCSARHESFTNRVLCDTPAKRLSKDKCETLPSVCSWSRWMKCGSGESEEIDNFCSQELNMTSCSAIRPCQWRSPYYIFPEQCMTNNPLFSEVCSTQSTRSACESYQPCGISFTAEQCGSIYPYFMRECEAVEGITECNAPLCKFEGNCVNR